MTEQNQGQVGAPVVTDDKRSVGRRSRKRLQRRRLLAHPLTVPATVVALVLIGLGLGFFAGYIQMPPDDPLVSQSQYDGVCPRSPSTKAMYTVTVEGTEQIDVRASLTVRMAGVRPYHAPSDQELGTPYMARNFAQCFIRADDGEVKHLKWRDGVFEIDIDFAGSSSAAEFDNGLVKVVPGTDHSTIWVDPCRPLAGNWTGAENTICRAETDNSITLDVKSPLSPVMASPFPLQQTPDSDGVRSTWHFAGSPAPIKADLRVPADIAWKSKLAWNGSVVYLDSIDQSLSADLVYLANNWDVIACLALVVFVLARLDGPRHGRPRYIGWLLSILGNGAPYLCFAAAVLLLAFQVDTLGRLAAAYGNDEQFYSFYWPIASAVIVVPAWVLLGVAFGSRRQRAVLPLLMLLALAPILAVAYIVPEDQLPQAATIWMTVFCVAFVSLLLTAGAAMWRPVSAALTGGSRERYPHAASTMVRALAAALATITFALAIAFPVGSLCNCGPSGWAKIPRAAEELVWNMGYQFAGVIVRIVILLVVIKLADRLLLESGPIPVARLIPLAALLLTLAAPWNSTMSLVEVVSWPLWFLQFLVLSQALFFVVTRRRISSEPAPATARPELLRAALELSDDDSSDVKPHRDDVAQLLDQGPADAQRSNAFAAAKIGAFLAVIPVGIAIWTAVVQVGVNLQKFSGLFLVVTLALIELARWVFSAMLYGFFHRDLPGKTGAVKAIWFTGLWSISCLVPLMIAQATGHHLVGETIYRSAQLGVFTLVLAIAFDYATIVTAGGDFGALKRLYNRQSLTDALPTIITGLGLAVALFQQLLAGSGFDAVSSLLDGLGTVLPLGVRH